MLARAAARKLATDTHWEHASFQYNFEVELYQAWERCKALEDGQGNDNRTSTKPPVSRKWREASPKSRTLCKDWVPEGVDAMTGKDLEPENPLPEMSRRALGTSRLVPSETLDRQGYEEGDFWLGRTERGRPFGWYEDMNLLTCAGTRAGKGVAVVVPNLLLYPGSAVVVDPKGELASMTAAYRHEKLGHKVVVLDPAGVADVPDELRGTYNPLSALDPSDPRVITTAQTIASGIVVPNPDSKEPFWDDNALDFIQACILYMTIHTHPYGRNLMKLRQLVSSGDEGLYQAYVEIMRGKDPDFEPSPAGAFDMMLKEMSSEAQFGGILRETAAKIWQMGENTRGSVLGTARTHLDFLKSPELWESLEAAQEGDHTFKLSELRDQDRPLTVYLCLPVDMMHRQGRWLRLIVTQIIQHVERTGGSFDKSTQLPLLMLIDEFAQLGPIPSILNTLTYAPGFGLRLWLIVQDLVQLKRLYGDSWETIFGACGVKQFFGVNDLFTAKYISELLGEAEVDVPSISLTRTASETESETIGETTGTSTSQTTGESGSRSTSKTWSDSQSVSHGLSSSETHGQSYGTSRGTNEGQGSSWGQNAGASRSLNHRPTGAGRVIDETHAMGGSTGTSHGTSLGGSEHSGSSSGVNFGRSESHSTSTSHTHSHSTSRGGSEGQTSGWSSSSTTGTSASESRSKGLSVTAGQNWALSYGKQIRRLYKPEELLLAFTKDNLLQLTHIRDRGGCLLFRTPYYADPLFRQLIEEYQNEGAAAP